MEANNPLAEAQGCGVCGDPLASRHFGAVCCRGCRGFFRRTVRLHLVYSCIRGDTCQLTQEVRNVCRKCRFTKCLEVGLNPRLVHSDRACDADHKGRRNSKKKSQRNMQPAKAEPSGGSVDTESVALSPTALLVGDHHSLIFMATGRAMVPSNDAPLSERRLISPFNRDDPQSVCAFIGQIDYFVDNFFEHEYDHFDMDMQFHCFNLNVSLADAIQQPRKTSLRSKMRWAPEAGLIRNTCPPALCRILTHFVDWASHFAEMDRLSTADRIRFLSNRMLPISWLLTGHRSHTLSRDKRRVLCTGGRFVSADADELGIVDDRPVCANPPTSYDIYCYLGVHLWDDVIDPARELSVTEAEFAILRAIALFTPVPKMSKEGREVIREARAFYEQTLTATIVRSNRCTDFRAVTSRMHSLLALLPPIEQLADMESNMMLINCMFDGCDAKAFFGRLTDELYIKPRYH